MKKSQRLRLAALQAQTSRTEAEAAELATLLALAAAHPDASKDEDDAKPDPKPAAALGLMAKFTAAFQDKERLAADNTTLRARIATLEAGLAGTVSLADVLTSAGLKAAELSGKSAADILAALRAPSESASATATAQVATLTTERDTARATLGSLASALGVSADQLAVTPENLAKFSIAADDAWKKLTPVQQAAHLAQAAMNEVIAQRTLAQVRELGFNADTLPGSSPSAGGESLADLQAQMAETKDPVRLGELASRANALRDQQWGKN